MNYSLKSSLGRVRRIPNNRLLAASGGGTGQIHNSRARQQKSNCASQTLSLSTIIFRPEEFEARIESLHSLHRLPIICTEYMARSNGSTFDTILPIAKRERVAVINWGLVAGKTQTYLPWDSWNRPYVDVQPAIWFHDIFKVDGSPYRQREIDLLRSSTGRGTKCITFVSINHLELGA